MGSRIPAWIAAQTHEWLEFVACYERTQLDDAGALPEDLRTRMRAIDDAWTALTPELRLDLHRAGYASTDERAASERLHRTLVDLRSAIDTYHTAPSALTKRIVHERAEPVLTRLRNGTVRFADLEAVQDVAPDARDQWLAAGNTAVEAHRRRAPNSDVAIDDVAVNSWHFPVGRWLVEFEHAQRHGVFTDADRQRFLGLAWFADSGRRVVAHSTRDTPRHSATRPASASRPWPTPAVSVGLAPATPVAAGEDPEFTEPTFDAFIDTPVERPELNRVGGVATFVRAGMHALRDANIELERWFAVRDADVSLRSGGHVTVKVELPDGREITFGDWLGQLCAVAPELNNTERLLLEAYGIEPTEPRHHLSAAREIGR